MATIIQTANLTPDTLKTLGQTRREWVYNGLDCCVTYEVLEALLPGLDEYSAPLYEFERGLQAPVLEMNLRGFLIDDTKRWALVRRFEADLLRLKSQLDQILSEGIGQPGIKWSSNKDLLVLFYGVLGLPPVKRRNPYGIMVPTLNRDALEKLSVHFYAIPIINHLLAMRDLGKKLGTLRTGIDPDFRFRTNYNIGGTVTGRFSSAMGDFGTGSNIQNITQALREIFVADPGFKLCNIDLEQADSRNIGWCEWTYLGDGKYLDACESEDLHTLVCRLTWPGLPWTGQPGPDKALAEAPYYRHLSYRDLAKRLGHGSNYMGTPPTMAMHTKIPASVARDFQARYFSIFPAHPALHDWVATELANKRQLVTPFGMRRHFFGRPEDGETKRAAVAHLGQSMTARQINEAMLRIWRQLDSRVQLLGQVHDSIVLQYPERMEDEIVSLLLRLMPTPLHHRDRTFAVPAEAKTGWNWANATDHNPDGLRKWKGGDTRRRTEVPRNNALQSAVDRVLGDVSGETLSGLDLSFL